MLTLCGPRRSELIALDLSDYDATATTLRVRSGKGNKQRLRSSSKPLQCWEGMVASLETELPLELVDTELPIIAFPLQHTERD